MHELVLHVGMCVRCWPSLIDRRRVGFRPVSGNASKIGGGHVVHGYCSFR